MKIVAIYGSARKKGMSAGKVQKILNAVQTPEDEVEEYWLADMNIRPCLGCMACRKAEVCARKGDDMEKLYRSIVSADFVIFSSPVYCCDVSGPFKLMFDRLYPMLAGPQGRYTPRHPGIKCCMVLSQGAPTFMFRRTAKTMRHRLKQQGFQNLGILRYGMGVDLTKEDEKLQKIGYSYLRHQEKKNDRKTAEITRKARI